MPASTGVHSPRGDDLETGQAGIVASQSTVANPNADGNELSTSLRELSSTVSTVIWRGFGAVRNNNILQRRLFEQDNDRDR